MSASGRSFWWPKDGLWWDREHVVELGLEFGADGPAVLDWLSCHAKLQNDGGWVKAGYQACGRGCFVEPVTVRHVVSRAVTLGALDDFDGDERRFTCRISGWKADNDRARAAVRQQDRRDRSKTENDGVEPNDAPHEGEQTVTRHGASRSVTPDHGESPTEEKRREEEKTPLTPRERGEQGPPSLDEVAPAPPEGGRQREQRTYQADLDAFAERHFAGIPSGYIQHEAARLRRSRIEPTVEVLRPLVERYRPGSAA